jgi:uncharacterized membrane protein
VGSVHGPRSKTPKLFVHGWGSGGNCFRFARGQKYPKSVEANIIEDAKTELQLPRSHENGNAVWETVATYCVAGGIVGAILAAVPGLIDYLSIDEAQMKRIANFHLAVNLGAVVIFAINLWLRSRLPGDSRLPLVLSVVGVAAIGVGGWLGGEMVYVKGMAVEAVDELAKKVERPTPRRIA